MESTSKPGRWRRRPSVHGTVVAVTSLLLLACTGKEAEIEDNTPVPAGEGAINLAQGWSASVQEQSWFTSFGSRMLPYAWILHLEQHDSPTPFRDADYLQRFGLLAATASINNPDALPVGVTRDIDSTGEAWVGFGCAACHTGEVHYNGTKVRLDGGAALFDFQGFETALIEALSATIADADKFDRFARGVLDAGAGSAALKTALVARTQYLRDVQQTNRTDVAYGHGRLDAFGQIFNAVAVTFLGLPHNRRAPDAPVSFPVLWSAPHLDLVQWNGSAPNSGPGPFVQNVTTALAVYGTLSIGEGSGRTGYASSVHIDNLGKIQEWFYELQAPRWPENIFGEIDGDLAARGAQVYAAECESCHQLADRNDRKRKLKVALTPVADVGTDPAMANNFINSMSASGVYAGRKTAVLAGPKLGATAPTIDLVVHSALGAALRHPLESVQASLAGYHKVLKANLDQHPNYYKARPLDGIWASAPYLHNGSVPSLADLLQTGDRRPTLFNVGNREFDPLKVGLSTRPTPDSSPYDTARPGNGNGGHEYGTTLQTQDKSALLEYLKTL